MEHIFTPQEIEQRAKDIGISVTEMCKRAGVLNQNFYRWRAGKVSPNLINYAALVKATAPVVKK